MEFKFFCGVLTAVLLGNGLSVLWAYALFRGDAMMRRGTPEKELPWWVFVGGALPPLIGAACFKYAVY